MNPETELREIGIIMLSPHSSDLAIRNNALERAEPENPASEGRLARLTGRNVSCAAPSVHFIKRSLFDRL